ncbi:MAG: hypothetical protein WA001_01635 [Patescibacteria group bacterium]
MASFSRGLGEQLMSAVRPVKLPEVPEGARINVHAAVSRFSLLYERIRNAVDYKDDHLLRKAAITRILNRQLILERNPDAIARHLVRELIAARYLPNGELSESIADDVAVRIRKYLAVERCRVGSNAHIAWLRGVLSAEIEELLVDATQQKALVTFLYERLADRVKVTGAEMSETDLRLQVYIACYRTLLKADDEVLGYKLLRAYMPEWLRPSEWIERPQAVAERLVGVERRVRLSLTHPLASKFQRTVKPWAVALNILRDVLAENVDEAGVLLEKPEAMHAAVTRIAEKRYEEAKTRLRRGAARATVYLLITKMLLAFAIEVPLEYLWYQHVAIPALVINLLFPPTLMFFVGLLIHVPGKDNTARLQANVDLLLSAQGVPMREIRVPRKHSFAGSFLLQLAYAFLFVVIFGGIGLMLIALHFTWVSALIFLFFLCVVSFFAFRLRMNAREYVIVEGKDTLGSLFMDFVSLPILRAGRLLSRGISRLNVFLFFFDFLFEAPFKMFLTVLEEWFAFIKEKREELQ